MWKNIMLMSTLLFGAVAITSAQNKKAVLAENLKLKEQVEELKSKVTQLEAEVQKLKSGEVDFNKEEDKYGYSYGQMIGNELKSRGYYKWVSPQALMQGVSDAFANSPKMKDNDAQSELRNLDGKVSEAAMAEQKAWFDENGKKEGIVTLASGMQYEIMTEGTGAKPGPTSKVTTHYHGTLLDGTVFDSSVDRGQPATFGVNQVIRGWTEALQLMPTGSKWRLYIPSDLAYGRRGSPPKIAPNAPLIFEVELISIAE